MYSKLASEARQARLAALRRLTPEQRLKAFLTNWRLMMELYEAGRKIRESRRACTNVGVRPMTFATADLVDDHADVVRSCDVQFRQYGKRLRFHGAVRTIKCAHDNALIKQMLATPGNGAVLVVDGGGSLSSALVGDMIAASAQKNGWAGLVIFGAIRDSVALADIDIGIKALGSNPWKSKKDGVGQVDVPLSFGGVEFLPGSWVYSDEDGILVSPRKL
jgi:regulator of ribonuclease activity A